MRWSRVLLFSVLFMPRPLFTKMILPEVIILQPSLTPLACLAPQSRHGEKHLELD